MVRVAGLHDRIDAGIEKPLLDGRTPTETLDEIRRMHRAFIARQSRCLEQELRPALAEHGIRIVGVDDVTADAPLALDQHLRRHIFPVRTPLAGRAGSPPPPPPQTPPF